MSGPRSYSAGTRAALALLSAGTCYFPDCSRAILEFIDGEPFVDFQIAHIKDALPGNRYDPEMTNDDRRSFKNLILLCKPHHTLVDKTHPERFDSDELQSWKDARERGGISAAAGLQAIAEEMLEAFLLEVAASSGAGELAAAITGVARASALLTSRARESRRPAAVQVARWEQTWQAARQGMFAWDPDTGDRLYAEPSIADTRAHTTAVTSELSAAHDRLAVDAAALLAELAAVRATSPAMALWCDGVRRAIDSVSAAVGRWPSPPPFEDDDVFERSLAELAEAVDALAGKWRGEEVPEPHVPPAPEPPAESEGERALREHRELVEEASRYRRAKALPYDDALAKRVLEAAEFAATVPPVPSLWWAALDSVAGLVASVARNSTEEEFFALLEHVAAKPLPVGVFVALRMASIADEEGVKSRSIAAKATVETLLSSADWSDEGLWADAALYAGHLLTIDASLVDPAATKERLNIALERNERILTALIQGCSEWSEQVDSRDFSTLLGVQRAYRGLPEWFPVEPAVAEIGRQYPQAHARENLGEGLDDIEALAGQVLFFAQAR